MGGEGGGDGGGGVVGCGEECPLTVVGEVLGEKALYIVSYSDYKYLLIYITN